MSFKKKVALTILMVVSVFCLIFGAVACKDDSGNGGNGGMSAEDAIARYILPQNQTLVDADFTLPKTIGSADSPVTVTWTSSNTAAIAIEDGGENYNAKVTIQDQVTEVTLTVSAEGNSKDFTVRVDGFSVYTFLDNYSFPQKNTAVKADFDLDTETTFQGKKATISWAIESEYSEFIALNEAENKVLVTPGSELVAVAIEATFSYNGEKATQKYPFSVTPELEHLQTVNRYYTEEGYPLELSGYIVHVFEASESYGNATFYMIDDDFCSGYYCFRVKIDKADVAKYVEGAHVTVSGDTTKDYSGLWENNGGGTAVVDDKEKINPREKVYALDTDILAGTPSTIYHESTFVSLSGWKVNAIGSKPSSWTLGSKGTEGNVVTLARGDTTIAVYLSKYIQRTQSELEAFGGLYDTLKVGDFVDVVGILGYHDGFQIQPVLVSDITKVDAEGANTDGAKVKAAVKAVDDAVKANFASLIAAHKEVEMPVSEQGVTISYKVAGASNPTVVINGGKFTVDPIDSEKNYDIQVTYTIGDYTGYSFFNLHNWKQSSEQIVDNVKAALEAAELAEVNHAGEFDLPVVDTLGTTITWAVKAPAPAWISIEGGKIKVTSLPAEDTEVTLVATIALDGQTATAELTLKVAAASALAFKAIDEPAAGEYIFSAMHKGERFYASSLELDGGSEGYIKTSKDVADAVKFTIEKHGDSGWYIKMGTKYLEINPYANNGKTSYKLKLVDTPSKDWTWLAVAKCFQQEATEVHTTENPKTSNFYIGNYDSSKYDTLSPSDVTRITGDSAKDLDVSQHPGRFGEMVAAELVFEAIDEPAEGDYIFSAAKNDTRLYASSLELDGGNEGYIQTSKDVADAVKFTLEKHGDSGWYIKMGTKYLEINPYENNGKTSYKLKLVDTPSKDWTWLAAAKCFQQEATEVHTTENPKTNNFYIGTYNTSKYDTLSPSDVTRITGDSAKDLDVSQHPGRFGEMVVGQPGTTEPEPEEPTPPVDEKVLYTLTTTQKGSNNSYAGNCDVEVDGVTWNIEGNSTENPWRFGGKNLSDPTDRKLTGKTAIKGTVKQVIITFGKATITVNKITFNVFSSDPTAEGATVAYTQEITFTAESAVTVDAPEAGWTDCFYQLVFNVTNEGSSNKYVAVSTIEFRSEKATGGTGTEEPELPEGQTLAKVKIADYADSKEWVDGNTGSAYGEVDVDEKIKVTVTGTPNTNKETGEPYPLNSGKYYTNGENWRIYQNENPSITFTAAEGFKIVSIKITYTVSNTGILIGTDEAKTQYASGTVITVNAATITFSVGNTGDKTNGQVRITEIEVIYASTESAPAATSVAPVAILPAKEL